MAAPARVHTRQIDDADIAPVAHLLAQGFRRSSWRNWIDIFDRLAQHRTPVGFPKYGYLMANEGVPVGAIIVVSSTLQTGSTRVLRCNLSSWYVSPPFRSFAPLFISKILRNKQATYINVSPAPHTLPILRVQGFSRYSDGQFLAFATPLPMSGDRRVKVVGLGERIDAAVEAGERDLLLAHAQYGCLCLWCTTPERAYPFVFRPRMIKGFIPCAQLIYCRDLEEFARFAKPLGQFLARRGRPIIMIDANGQIPGLAGIYVKGVLPKYYKGPVPPSLGDLAYTETALFGI